MGAINSCCSVEDTEDRQVMKEPAPTAKERSQTSSKHRKDKERKEPEQNESTERKEPKEEKNRKKRQAPPPEPAIEVSQQEIKDMQTKLHSGMSITVLLKDGTKLSCTIHLNLSDNSLSISCEDKVRVIPLSDVKALLHTADQLKRVETQADLVGDSNCVALHLLESGNCIPLRFEEARQKHSFVEMLKQLKSE
ncbi:uncharacterized protein LOC34620032 [Cyclospora cayetanensis]|uniref:IMC sub-compartment protein ISP1 n=2 Tax=Cyclospora cayetanensis TaxID=88456 RepID=A0A1D3D805_9EIME|nr:uncharacterized protein LOC34620032 [Cyclospora cayetanensis]OEH79590.1 IMC sub-compartment protein ISP1 [Cyclospora cayetanensis]